MGAAWVLALVAAAVTPPLIIVPLRADLDPAARVGARRTGVFCAPAGATSWRDAAPEPLAVAASLATALRMAGADAITAEEGEDDPAAARGRRRLTLRITAAHIDACVPQHGLVRAIGGRRRLRASGTLSVHWRSIDPDGGSAPLDGDLALPVDAATVATLPAAVGAAIDAAAPALIAQLSLR